MLYQLSYALSTRMLTEAGPNPASHKMTDIFNSAIFTLAIFTLKPDGTENRQPVSPHPARRMRLSRRITCEGQ